MVKSVLNLRNNRRVIYFKICKLLEQDCINPNISQRDYDIFKDIFNGANIKDTAKKFGVSYLACKRIYEALFNIYIKYTYSPDEFLDKISISTRSYNCLAKAGLITPDLIRSYYATHKTFKGLPNLGNKENDILISRLKELGIIENPSDIRRGLFVVFRKNTAQYASMHGSWGRLDGAYIFRDYTVAKDFSDKYSNTVVVELAPVNWEVFNV